MSPRPAKTSICARTVFATWNLPPDAALLPHSSRAVFLLRPERQFALGGVVIYEHRLPVPNLALQNESTQSRLDFLLDRPFQRTGAIILIVPRLYQVRPGLV